MFAVIVPFFQRTPGVLSRTLRSIADQDVQAPVNVYVVDDASPVSPVAELAGIEWREGFSLEIIRRPNGGPGAARNAGLSALRDERYLAFLDSDDCWSSYHLSSALQAFESGYDLFLADWSFAVGGGTGHARFYRSGLPTRPCGTPEWACELVGNLASLTVNGPICRAGVAVFRRQLIGDTRFDESLRTAGEDGLFATEIAVKNPRVMISRRVDLILGRGVNIFSAGEWGSDETFRRALYFHRSKLLMKPLVKAHAEPWRRLAVGLGESRANLIGCMLSRMRRGVFPVREMLGAILKDPALAWTVMQVMADRIVSGVRSP